MWILVEMSQPGVATSARWEKRWWQNGAAGGGVGGAPPPHSWAESSSDWPVLLSRANLTRRPHRPRRCHTEHSTTAITSKKHKNREKCHQGKSIRLRISTDDQRQTMTFALLLILLFPERCQPNIWKMSNSWKHIWYLISFEPLKVYFTLISWRSLCFRYVLNHLPIEKKSDPHCTWNESKGNPCFWLMLRLSCILENWLKTLPWKMLFENCS